MGLACGHERYFTPTRSGCSDASLQLLGDASWLAVPFLRELPSDTVILHQVRDPVRTINSMLHTKHFAPIDDPYRQFMTRHTKGIDQNWSQERTAMFFWRYWTGVIEETAGARKYLRYRIDDLTPGLLGDVTEIITSGRGVDSRLIAEALTSVPKDYNRRGSPIGWINRQNLCPKVRDLAIKYGYQY
jgi:hypothetical protein